MAIIKKEVEIDTERYFISQAECEAAAKAFFMSGRRHFNYGRLDPLTEEEFEAKYTEDVKQQYEVATMIALHAANKVRKEEGRYEVHG